MVEEEDEEEEEEEEEEEGEDGENLVGVGEKYQSQNVENEIYL